MTIPAYALSPGLVALTLFVVGLLRGRRALIRVVGELGLLVVLGQDLLSHGATPFGIPGPNNGASIWLRVIAALWWLIAARVVATLTELTIARDARSRHARLFTDLLGGAIYVGAVIIILNFVLDLPVKGLLATSGVIAIALGLALQSTLADVFSGIATGLDQPFRVGDHIRVADLAEGRVVEINWRAIRIATDGDSQTTVPHSIVARSKVTNHSVPSERRQASVEIPTLSQERAEYLMDLVRQAILLCPAILADPPPDIAVKRLGLRTTTIGVDYWVATSSALSTAHGQVLRQVRRLFRHAGIGAEPAQGDSSAEGLLRGLALFETLSTEHLARLAGQTRLHSYEPGETLMEQHSHGKSLFVVRAGVFELRREIPGAPVSMVGRVGPGEYLGEVSMMSGEPRSVTVACIAAGSAYELPREALEALIREDRSLSAALERSVQRGLSRLERDDAARAEHPLDAGGSILRRIREFLRSPS